MLKIKLFTNLEFGCIAWPLCSMYCKIATILLLTVSEYLIDLSAIISRNNNKMELHIQKLIAKMEKKKIMTRAVSTGNSHNTENSNYNDLKVFDYDINI